MSENLLGFEAQITINSFMKTVSLVINLLQISKIYV